jgi:hypothetical protein
MVDFDGDWNIDDTGDMDLDLGEMELEIEDTEDSDATKKSTVASSWTTPSKDQEGTTQPQEKKSDA